MKICTPIDVFQRRFTSTYWRDKNEGWHMNRSTWGLIVRHHAKVLSRRLVPQVWKNILFYREYSNSSGGWRCNWWWYVRCNLRVNRARTRSFSQWLGCIRLPVLGGFLVPAVTFLPEPLGGICVVVIEGRETCYSCTGPSDKQWALDFTQCQLEFEFCLK